MADVQFPRADLDNALVGYILISFKTGKFLPMVGRVHWSEEDNDAFIEQVATQPAQVTYDEALACFEGAASEGIDHIFRHPVSSNITGITWLSELTAAEAAPVVLIHQGHQS